MYNFQIKILFLLNLYYHQVQSKNIKCSALIDHELKTYNNLENYMDATCAQCYWYMAGTQTHWKNSSVVNPDTNFVPVVYGNQSLMYMCFRGITDCHLFNYTQIITEENNIYLEQFENDNHKVYIFFLKSY